uniref:Reverse transcriptase domain-containing protein n=1 Tax=Tanacetum cinerariifolium TaxID=118510 RepID=A0A6L2LA29_TANCI|nr:hypothetical protein [Tanacetum cinerariifolium]
MRDAHLDTNPSTKSEEFIKSSVENLIPNPSESENLSDDIAKEIYLNPLFDEEIISIKIDPQHFNAESDLIESLLNYNSSIISSSSKIDSLLEEFPVELILLKSIPLEIDEIDCDPEEEIRLIEKLLYDNSSPQLLSLPENESFHFDIPSFSRPPAKPPDDDSGILTVKVVVDISELYVPMPRLLPTQPTFISNQEKSPNLLSHRGFKASQLHSESQVWRDWVKLSDPKQALRGRHPMLILGF